MTAFPEPASAPSQPQARGEAVVHDRRITVDGVETQYLEAGAGPLLVLLHGHEQGAASWRWVIPALARTHRVLALSLPGHGESGPAAGGHAPGADLAPFVAAFLVAVGAGEPLDLVGHSAGGAIAVRLTLAGPARIRTLTLVDSAGLGREVHPLLALDTLPVICELAVMISRMPGGDLARTTMSAAMLFAQPGRIPAEFVTEQHALGRRPGQLEASTAMARALFGPHGQRQILLDRLPALTTPTLVVWGDRDYLLPVQQARAAVNSLPHGRLSVFPDCGHLPHIEHPHRFAAVLGSWLTEPRDHPGSTPSAPSPSPAPTKTSRARPA
jgi:pimeloyl-ACP methyl ester carboxylesterase